MTTLQAKAQHVPIFKTLVAVLVLNVAATLAMVGLPAGAAEQPVARVSETKDFKASFGPIPLQNPVIPTVLQDPTPDECELAAAWCDVIPVEVELPADYDPELTYLFTTVELTWAQPPESNDLDMYFWVQDDEGEFEENGGSATGAKPERGSTEAHSFFVVINNFSGANDGYELSVKVTVERLGEKPFELLEPPAKPLDLSAGEPPVTPSATPVSGGGAGAVDISPRAPVSPVAAPSVTPNFAGVDSTPVIADVDFAPKIKNKNAIVGEGAFGAGSSVAAPEVFQNTGASSPVPTGVLVLWLGVLPLAVLALAAVWLLRRGSARLTVTA